MRGAAAARATNSLSHVSALSSMRPIRPLMEKARELTSLPESPLSNAAPTSGPSSPDELYVLHAPLLRRVAIRKFRIPPADAESLVHDVFINYLKTTRVIRRDLRSYLIGAICNASRNYWRSRRTEGRVFSDDDPGSEDVISEDLFAGLALNLVIASTLARLGERCREALRRYYLEGEDTVSIAAAMNTSPANVNYMMHVCRKRAREVYEEITRAR